MARRMGQKYERIELGAENSHSNGGFVFLKTLNNVGLKK
jgi:hypothetical protein